MSKKSTPPVSKRNWTASIPKEIWIALITGAFGLAGISLTAYLASTKPPPPTATLVSATLLPTAAATSMSMLPLPTQTTLPGHCPADMVYIPAGPFWMGTAPTDSHAKSDEKPGRMVTLDAFCIDKLEVSNQQYVDFVNTGHRPPPPAAPQQTNDWVGTLPRPEYNNYPIVRVSWDDARSYCEWKDSGSALAHRRLPTEAEWERAARGAQDKRIYPWGDIWDPTRANFNSPQGSSAQPVESNPNGHSPEGVLNMAGNVAEWVNDWYQADWYSTPSSSQNPKGPDSSTLQVHVVRGGNFRNNEIPLRTSARSKCCSPQQELAIIDYIGFRCARYAN